MSCDEAPANGSSTREPAAIDQPLGERDVSTTSRVGLGAAPGAGAAPAGGGGGVPECVLSDTLAAEGIDVGIAPGRADASAGGECTASGDDGDGAAAAGLSVLPAAAGTEARLTWMLEQLNTLPWQKVDVDCRHMHAHAAIVVRKVWHGTQFRVHDHLHYMLDQAEW
uniref:Uncharacterized protein n=1 Tax=Chlamydomonas euryale TaxID=1486919 RepID=A0A7R9V255_9CHLO|eukprot:365791-Chlamydomonas_euryale.AAC.6